MAEFSSFRKEKKVVVQCKNLFLKAQELNKFMTGMERTANLEFIKLNLYVLNLVSDFTIE